MIKKSFSKKIKWILLLFSILNSVFLLAKSNNVLYGERNLKNQNIAIYFDKEGNAYPNTFISNSSLDSCYASLSLWYSKHPQELTKIAKQYNCTFTRFSLQNIKILNDSIILSVRKSINAKKNQFKSVSFLIHGYRKPFTSEKGDKTSPTDFLTMKQNINKFARQKTLYVEVYWDALYCSKLKEPDELFSLFELSQKNAIPVGHSFRKLLNDLKFDTINIITHSLGAKVANYALFNCDNFDYPTPSNKRINVCLVAPAIGGTEVYKNYFLRKTSIDFQKKDNYKLAILYNSKDFVLLKKVSGVGPGPYKYGNTSLGCNFNDASIKLVKYFETYFPHSQIKAFDLSKVGSCHHVSCYFSGNNIESVIQYLDI